MTDDWTPSTVEPPKNKNLLLQGACGGMYVGKYMGKRLGFRIWSDLEGYKRIGCLAWQRLPKPYIGEFKK